MDSIINLAVTDEKGKSYVWTGHGRYSKVETRVVVDGLPPNQWPTVKYIYARLVIEEKETL